MIAGSDQSLDSTYHRQLSLLQSRLALEPEQEFEIGKLLEARKDRERHLRKQMRTTYTPPQQREIRELWQKRGRPVSDDERKAIRARLGVTLAQERQLKAYHDKITSHRAQTLSQVAQYLSTDQRSILQTLPPTF